MVTYEYTGTFSMTSPWGPLTSAVTGNVTSHNNEVMGILQLGTTEQYIPVRGNMVSENSFVGTGKTYVLRKEVIGTGDDKAVVGTLQGLFSSTGLGIIVDATCLEGNVDITLALTKVVVTVSDGAKTSAEENIDMTPKDMSAPVLQRINVKKDPFLNMANLLGVTVLDSDTNQDLQEKFRRASKDQRNSTYDGLLNAIAQDLNLDKKAVLRFETRLGAYEPGSETRPIIEIDGSFVRIFKNKIDTEHFILDLEVSLRDGTLESLAALSNYINQKSTVVTTTVIDKPEAPPKLLMIQGNVKDVFTEFLESSTHIKLQNNALLHGYARFSNKNVFRNEVADPDLLIETGDYYVDYENGVVRTVTLPELGDYIAYKWLEWPYEAEGCDAILGDLNGRPLRRHMFEQIQNVLAQTNDPTQQTFDGLPQSSSLDTLKELFNVAQIHWGK